ncbi:uncharacterized protein [Danio rerio]|uniref:C2H2-type domain-containing protein n=1 Tax=Danio rerio TaxID=7955 RepID=A0A8N7TFN0_DANRE|nr:uncharacterized protein LOC570021 [Danio rerio]|eukprot:XP_706537.4 uncharacterized protein LOC570021 [Danio rerio]
MKSLLTLSVFLVLIKEDNGEKPEVSRLPRFPQVYVGDDVTFICKGGSNPTKWIINGIEQPHQNHVMLLTTVTPHNNGQYECEQNGEKSVPVPLTVLVLEALAQLSPSVGGAVITKGEGRNLVLQVDDAEELHNWKCFALRGESGVKFNRIDVNKKLKRAVIFAELKEAERATFWCLNKNKTHRSNAVTLKMTDKLVMLEPPAAPALLGDSVALRCVAWGAEKVEKATFYKNQIEIPDITADTYNITATPEASGTYHCHATYRYSHISATAAEKEGDSDAQEIKVIDGPPAASITVSGHYLECSCPKCPDNCTSCYWYYTPFNDKYNRTRLPEDNPTIYLKEAGNYSCRMNCGKGFSRFSQHYRHKAQSGSGNVLPIILGLLLLVIGLLIVALVAKKQRKKRESNIQEANKDKTTGGDYEQLHLKDTAVYHTLGESTGKDKAEGEYEPLKKTKEETVYHTLGSGEGQSQGEGGYQGLESVKAEVYQTLSSEGQSQGEGGYQGLESVKAEVYQTLSSDASKNPEGEAGKAFEHLSQKAGEALTEEENPYEELKAEKQKKEPSKETE